MKKKILQICRSHRQFSLTYTYYIVITELFPCVLIPSLTEYSTYQGLFILYLKDKTFTNPNNSPSFFPLQFQPEPRGMRARPPPHLGARLPRPLPPPPPAAVRRGQGRRGRRRGRGRRRRRARRGRRRRRGRRALRGDVGADRQRHHLHLGEGGFDDCGAEKREYCIQCVTK